MCSIGWRSSKLAEKLALAGCRNVVNLEGGTFEWVNQGHALVGPDGARTTLVHPYNAAFGLLLNPENRSPVPSRCTAS